MIAYAVSIKYMIAGYAVIFIVLIIYLISLFIRWRRFQSQLQMLEDLKKSR
jgi:hypothetical protein